MTLSGSIWQSDPAVDVAVNRPRDATVRHDERRLLQRDDARPDDEVRGRRCGEHRVR